jgi:hypothetical protein
MRAPFWLGGLLILALSVTLKAQDPVPAQDESSLLLFRAYVDVENSPADKGTTLGPNQNQDDDPADASKRKGTFAFAPLLMTNPSIGNSGGVAVLDSKRTGKAASPPSTFDVTRRRNI